MFEEIICLFTGSLGFIILLLMVFRFKQNRNINVYFIAIIFLGSLRFLIWGLLCSDLTEFPYHLQINNSFYLFSWPLLYLYFKRLVKVNNGFKYRDLLHLISPALITSYIWLKNYLNTDLYTIASDIVVVLSLCLSIIYAFMSYKLLKKNVWNRTSNILVINQQNKLIKEWTLILFTLSVIMLVRVLINLAMNNDAFWFKNKKNYTSIGAFIWTGIYIKMLYSPEILYGYQEFQKKIKQYKKQTIIFDNIWITNKPKEFNNIQDSILEEKITENIENYILSIEDLAINSDHFFAENCSTTDLANKLGIPKSHVLYIFKYHSKIKFSHFRKIIRIQKTILLIEEGYLKKDTMESLASVAGFTSYSSFFKSFKSITGVSPQEYVRD